MIDVEKLKKLHEDATPGPWKVDGGANSHCFDGRIMSGEACVMFAEADVTYDDEGDYTVEPLPDAELVTFLRNSVSAILAMTEERERSEKHRNGLYDKVMGQLTEIGALKAETARLREALERIAEGRTGSRGETLPHDAHTSQRIALRALGEEKA